MVKNQITLEIEELSREVGLKVKSSRAQSKREDTREIVMEGSRNE